MGTVGSHLVPAQAYTQAGWKGWSVVFQFFFRGISCHLFPSLLLLCLLVFSPLLQTLLPDSAMSSEVDWWKGEWEVRKF